jgi:hypothetical protein
VVNTEQNNIFHPFYFPILLSMIYSLVNKRRNMMQKITDELSDLERYFRQTHEQCTANTHWFARWLYIPIEERMQILDNLLLPHTDKSQEKNEINCMSEC